MITGALSLLPEEKTPAQVTDSKREVSFAELSERIHDRANRPFNVWDGRVRMSIAGHQDNLGVNHKYERNFGSGRDVKNIRDGVSFEKLFSVASISQTGAATRMSLLRWALLQYLIGNSDAHGKNLSFLVEPGGLRPAPAYDLAAVCIYPDFEHDLAMAIGDEFNVSKVRAFDWADFAERCNIERRLLVREMNRMIKVVRKQLPSLLAWPDYTEGERGVLRGICDFSLRQADQMEDDARFVTQVKLS